MSSETQARSEHKHNTKPSSQPPAAKHSDVPVFQQANPAALVQRAAHAPPTLSANNVSQLQRAVGNQAVGGLVAQTSNQKKGVAQRLGADVMSFPLALESNHSARGKRAKAQLKRNAGAGAAPGSVVTPDDLGHGRPIDSGTAARMGQAFGGENFGDVRIHTEAAAAQKTRDLNAGAMAMGSHVAFAPGEYQPGTPSGDSLIAHELAHVIQQRGSEPFTQRRAAGVQPAGTPQEHDADQAAAAVVARLHAPAAGGEASASAGAPIRPALASGLGVQRGRKKKPAKKKRLQQTERQSSVYSASPEERDQAISEAYDKLLDVAARFAKENHLRFTHWSLNQIIKDDTLKWFFKKLMGEKIRGMEEIMVNDLYKGEVQDIIASLCTVRYGLNPDTARAAILAVPRVRRRAARQRSRAARFARAADRRLVPRQTVSDSDVGNDRDNKFIVNKYCDDLLEKYPQALEQGDHDKMAVAAAVKKAKDIFAGQGSAMLLSMNYSGMHTIFRGLLKEARQKGYPVWDANFLVTLLKIATALTYLGTSGSVNADREDAGGDKAKMRR